MPHPDRRAEPGAVISTQTALGESVRLTANDDGIVHIRNADQLEVADYLQLPVVKPDQGDKPAKPKEG